MISIRIGWVELQKISKNEDMAIVKKGTPVLMDQLVGRDCHEFVAMWVKIEKILGE